MPDRIKLQVARYRPDQGSEATFEEFEVPCPKDWVVLDGLNHIKDRIDGTLAYRWSCRMGVCGSCGMTVNGEPKLTCATFLADYAPGPVKVEPLKNFPVIRDLIVDIGDFMKKLVAIKPWIVRAVEKPLSEGERFPPAAPGFMVLSDRRVVFVSDLAPDRCESNVVAREKQRRREVHLECPRHVPPQGPAVRRRQPPQSRDRRGGLTVPQLANGRRIGQPG